LRRGTPARAGRRPVPLAWIALRTDRAVHQAGERSPIEQLRFVRERWLSAEERALLMVWLRRRVAAGRSIRPPRPRGTAVTQFAPPRPCQEAVGNQGAHLNGRPGE